MSFGVIQSMIISIRNNKNLLNKRKRFQSGLGLNGNNSKPKYTYKKPTAEQIRNLKKRLQKENQRKQLQTNITMLVLLILIIALGYLLVF